MSRVQHNFRWLLGLCLLALIAGGGAACTPDPVQPPNNGGEETPDVGEDEDVVDEPDNNEPDLDDPDPDVDDPDVEDLDVGDVPDPNDFPDVDLPDPKVVCAEYDFRGQVFNCADINECPIDDDFQRRLACCECDPYFCNPPQCPAPNPVCGDGICEQGEYAGQEYECEPDCGPPPPDGSESCMQCHNGAAQYNDYSGPGLSNPHPFPPADKLTCTQCHGGNGQGAGKNGSHVPNPPEILNDQILIQNPVAYFNRLTMTGLDTLGDRAPDQPYDGNYTNLDFIQFINPGDLRVVAEGRGCGANGCHYDEHAQWVPRSNIANTTGLFSASRFTWGADNRYQDRRGPQNPNTDGDSLADSAPRAINNPAYNNGNREIGEVGSLRQQPEIAGFYQGEIQQNPGVYDANTLANHIYNANEDPARPNRVKYNSPLDKLLDEQVNITCGDCHLYSAGANNRYADFRSSGCTACHMEYSYDGKSRSGDPNVNREEPADPDAIAAPERPHVESHQIRNVAKFLRSNGAFVRGISDRACVGCHQGSNRTVLQFWGVRLDQNQDVTNNFQYPANPANFIDAAADTRLYDPAVGNNTFNGRAAAQHLVFEDYDADGRDDTPPDVHYDAGMACIDCHGSWDLHGGTRGNPDSGKIRSRQDQNVAISCESCHGSIDGYAGYQECQTYNGQTADCATDTAGNALRHVTRDGDGNYWLVSRLDGQRHYIPQTRDTVIYNPQKRHPFTQQQIYNPKASYAMGRADGNTQTGIGPLQENPNLYQNGFSHNDTMDCASCHASWTNNCIGCHLANQYDINPQNYLTSNITGERILLAQAAADFVYQSPVPFYLGVNSRGKITKISPAEKFFYRFYDYQNNESAVLAFSDRLGEGNNPNNGGRNAFPALSHNQLSAHSIRGAVNGQYEGPTYCAGCHLNVDSLNNFGDEYADFLDAYNNNDFANLDFDLLQEHIGQNPGNQLNSPLWVHMAAGRGSGLYLFDATGCPVNPLDANADRQYCPNGAPADNFNNAVNDVVYDLDRLVEFNGVPNAGSTHPRLKLQGAQRIGASNGQMAGPLGAQTLQKLTDPNLGRILDSWIDADGNLQGGAANFVQ